MHIVPFAENSGDSPSLSLRESAAQTELHQVID